MQTNGILTLLTDFGLKDGYVATMKGVILSIVPQVRLIDITHEIVPQAIGAASYLLHSTYHYFPPGTVHLAVVDPGVGSERRAIAVKTAQYTFVGPDNGLLSPIVEDALMQDAASVEIVELTEADYWRHEVSTTFHGRDIFAPVAAHLVDGVPLQDLGRTIHQIHPGVLKMPAFSPTGLLQGEIIHVDRFGNCVTNVRLEHLEQADLRERLIIEIAGQRIQGLFHTYSAGPVGLPMALIGSSGHLELAVYDGDASRWLGVTTGDRLRVVQPEPAAAPVV